jgi:hypothetical protein
MEYPKEQIDFLQAVFEMREAQRGYFAQRAEKRLKLAKIKEQRVDALLKKYINAGLINTTSVSVDTSELFT